MSWSYWNQTVQDAAGNALAGRNFTVWTAETSGTQVTSTLRTWAGATVSDGVIPSDSDGQLRFKETSNLIPLLWAEAPDGRRYPVWALEAIGLSVGAGNVSDNTSETITGTWTFSTNPVFNNGAIPQAKVVDLTTDLAAAANPQHLADTANQAAMLALSADLGDWTKRTDTASVWVLMLGTDPTVLGNWVNLGAGSGSFTPSYANAPAGSVFYVKGLSTMARPSSRTDILFLWLTTDGLTPVNMTGDDVHLNALES